MLAWLACRVGRDRILSTGLISGPFSRGMARYDKHNFESKFTFALLIFEYSVQTHPHSCLVSRVVSLGVFRLFESSLLSSFRLVRPLIQPVRFYEPSDPLARGVPLKYFRFRPSGRCLRLPNFGVVIQLFAGRLPAASARLASSGLLSSRPSTCPVLSFPSVVVLLFPVRPKSFISAPTV
jgi:hypothetical protein